MDVKSGPQGACVRIAGQKRVESLRAPGGEIIRDLNETSSLRKRAIEEILFDVIDDDAAH